MCLASLNMPRYEFVCFSCEPVASLARSVLPHAFLRGVCGVCALCSCWQVRSRCPAVAERDAVSASLPVPACMRGLPHCPFCSRQKVTRAAHPTRAKAARAPHRTTRAVSSEGRTTHRHAALGAGTLHKPAQGPQGPRGEATQNKKNEKHIFNNKTYSKMI
jgi:hypothetical protein